MNKYNEHVKESIDYFNHELECMKHRVCNCDMQTSLRIGREKTAYETAIECLKKQFPQSSVKAIHKSIIHENRGDSTAHMDRKPLRVVGMPVLWKHSMEWHKYCKEITILLRLRAED